MQETETGGLVQEEMSAWVSLEEEEHAGGRQNREASSAHSGETSEQAR